MIDSLRGTLLSVTEGSAVLDVAGVGYRVLITPRHAATLRTGHEVTITTTLIVREDSMTLFGFTDADERRVFDLLLDVGGVGPKSALGVLGALTVDEIADAVAREDEAPFKKVSGIGPKTAKLIAVSLSGKLAAPRVAFAGALSVAASPLRGQLISALAGLGWPERVADEVVERVLTAADADRVPVAELLRRALGELGPRGLDGGGS